MTRVPDPEDLPPPSSKYSKKCIFAQVLAAGIGLLLTLNVSTMLTMITIVNGKLKKKDNSSVVQEMVEGDFVLLDSQASLYGTVQIVSNLLASIIAGILSDRYGRKKTLLMSFLPHISSWIILYLSTSVLWLYSHALAIGIGTAFSEYVVITYISEIARKEWRGRLFSVGKFGYGMGSFIAFGLSNFLHWRKLTLVLLPLPWILPIYMMLLPESPLWLMSKGREKECRRSLMWLRGWTDNSQIEDEFRILKFEVEERNAATTEKSTATTKLKLLTQPEFLEPFKISMCLFFSSFLLGLRPARFYFIDMLNKLGVEGKKEPEKAVMTATGIAGIAGCICLAMTIRKIGKRSLTLWTFTATAICLLVMGLYSAIHTHYSVNAVWVVYVLFVIIFCFGGYTLGGMPWFISSEIFPQRYRGFCCSISGMCAHAMVAVMSQTYLGIQSAITVTNVFYSYGAIGLVCCYYLYRNLPETENKSLHELEEYFRNKNKRKDNVFDKTLPGKFSIMNLISKDLKP